MDLNAPPADWSADRSEQLYNLPHWSDGYFRIGANGHVLASTAGPDTRIPIDIYELARQLPEQGFSLPAILRFTDILSHRHRRLIGAFQAALDKHALSARYTSVYPVKVNQQRSVVRGLVGGLSEQVGLEVGSKPELLAVLGEDSHPVGTVICNGYKDRGFIRLALRAQQLGMNVTIVIEKLSELPFVVSESRALGIRPRLGLRVRMGTIGQGKWQNSGGEKSKFGLSAAQVIRLIDALREHSLLDCLDLMHTHLGSQIPDLDSFRRGMGEAAAFFAALWEAGATIRRVDVGGGLGIDYQGTASTAYCSAEYSLQDYADTVVGAFASQCRERSLPCPDFLTESGRALTAHHSVLVMQVNDVESRRDGGPPPPIADSAPPPLLALRRTRDELDALPPESAWQAAREAVAELQRLFAAGRLSLQERALGEQWLNAISTRLAAGHKGTPDLEQALGAHLADKYFCNFSLFQTIPDAWAFNQIFPIMPLHRLQERPSTRGVIMDLTCDSDGQVFSYVDAEGIDSSLPLHPVKRDEPYLLGIFLIGAYQETLGDIHNLFGSTHAIDIAVDEQGWRIARVHSGERAADVLDTVDFRPDDLAQGFTRRIMASGLPGSERQQCANELRLALTDYTYPGGL